MYSHNTVIICYNLIGCGLGERRLVRMDFWLWYLLGCPVYLYFLYRLNIIFIKAAYSIYNRNTIKNKIDRVYLGTKEWEERLLVSPTHPNWPVGQLAETISKAYLFESPRLIPRYNELRKVYNYVMKSDVISEFHKYELAYIFLHKGIIKKVNMEDKFPYQVKVEE